MCGAPRMMCGRHTSHICWDASTGLMVLQPGGVLPYTPGKGFASLLEGAPCSPHADGWHLCQRWRTARGSVLLSKASLTDRLDPPLQLAF